MHRRTFVQALGASLAAGPWASRRSDRPGRLARIGLELYSVRDAMRRDPPRTLAAVRALGYSDRELLWALCNFGGTVPYDVFVARTDPAVVRLQLDVGNLVMGGGDPLVYLQRYRDRYWSFHLKDVVPDRSRDTELGTGTLDFRRLLAAVPDIDHKPCYVEQEGAADSLASARRNCAFLSKLEF